MNTPDRAASAPAPLPPIPRVRKRLILGIPVAAVDYGVTMDVMDALVARREPGYVCVVAVHALMVAQEDPETRAALLGATLTVPDGMPLIWASNWLGENLQDRVYGPELMRRYDQRCAELGHRVWLYGGHDQHWLDALVWSMRRRHPRIEIVGGAPHPRRRVTAAEEDELVRAIEDAQPDVLWIGLGAPCQEKWMARMRPRLSVPVMCGVGAAFNLNAGRVREAPDWMQQRGLEWTYRIAQEPRRLFPRYARYNPRFVWSLAGQLLRERVFTRRA